MLFNKVGMWNNYSYHSIVLVFLQTLFTSNRALTVRLGWRDNADPRQNINDMEKSGKFSPNLIRKLRRRAACHENCWEALGIFCASVVAGNQAGLSSEYMTKMTGLFFLIRCAFIYAYLNIDDKKLSYIRSLIYWAGNFCFLTTFVKAGNKLNASVL